MPKAPSKPKKYTKKQQWELQCEACPLLEFKRECQDDLPDELVDILVFSEYDTMTLENALYPYKARQHYLVECAESEDDTKAGLTCCTSRKMDLIEVYRPKLVITVGYPSFKAVEQACGHKPKGISDFLLLPTEYKDHTFWVLSVPDYKSYTQLKEAHALVERAMTTSPSIERGNDEGVIFVTDNEGIEEAFKWLMTQPLLAFDIETNGLNPYGWMDTDKKSKTYGRLLDRSLLLSLAIGTDERIYVFPLQHKETPSRFNWERVLELLWELAAKTELIAHNLVFELFWLNKYLPKFLYHGTFHDTMAQEYLMTTAAISLDACVRRYFGFSLKALSDITVSNLENEPLEKVLAYNALDVKYTFKLYLMNRVRVMREGLINVYNMHIRRIPAIVLMQTRGLLVDQDFVKNEAAEIQAAYTPVEALFESFEEVKKFKKEQGRDCNPFSTKKDLPLLLKQYCGAPPTMTSFAEESLSTFKHPIVPVILELRKLSKLYSTYVNPFDLSDPEGGKHIFPDGRMRPTFNGLRAKTGRFTSSNPNGQNFPSRGGGKRYRNLVIALLNYLMVAIDFGQIEYRVIAALTKDKEMVHAIWNGHDVHMYWTLRLMELFPRLVKDHDDKDQVKEFRSSVKNGWTFPLCFGSANYSIQENLGLKRSERKKLDAIIKEFWDRHEGVKKWHIQLEKDLNKNGYITNPFGRKFRAPLDYNKMINYPIQSTASDIVVEAMSKLARMSVEHDLEDLAPVINIHDDLSYYIEESALEELLPIIIGVMLDTEGYEEWLNVPLTVEVSAGYQWGNLKEIGTFSSDTFNPDELFAA